MRTRAGEESLKSGRNATRDDGLYSLNGTGLGNGGVTQTQNSDSGTGGAGRGREDAVGQTTWFDPVVETMECKDGVCPVPWAVKEEAPVVQPDEVNHPPHYTDGGIECIEAIEASLTPEEFRGYCKGNLMKYGWRERLKGGTKSLKKAQWYLDRLIQFDEAQNG